ncbi:hypothetical protein COL22_02110 [Bacillus thuringiensis]|uniref:hypothetical protein n=1 Tax=Bacillus thuringiensis TaxID=1428 RepID=UPI000BF9AB06|nr:hypothetical protein [Bacillus thuringiensis]PFW16454.1 hypothetical protein COL22_02110 [Bacillus thuringiensis]
MTIEQIRAGWDQVLNSLVNEHCRRKYTGSFPISLEKGTLTILLRNENIDPKYNSRNLGYLENSILGIFKLKVKCESKAFDKILIKEAHLRECIRFAINTLNPNGSEMTMFDFQNQERSARSKGDYFIDVIEGKLAEFAFSDFCDALYGFTFEIDTKIYKGTTVTDGGNDVQILYHSKGKYISNLKVDIKSTKVGHQWLLVEKKKIFADVYVLVKLQFENESFLSDINIDLNQLDSETYRESLTDNILLKFKGLYHAEIAGFALLTDLIDPITNKPWFEFASEEKLLKVRELESIVSDSPEKNREIIREYQDVLEGLKIELKAEVNYGLPANLLRKNFKAWQWLLKKIEQVSIPFHNQIYLNAYQDLIKDQEKIDERVQELKKRRDKFK